jgi:hypothetical protein
MSEDLVFGLYIFALATFVGYQVIASRRCCTRR